MLFHVFHAALWVLALTALLTSAWMDLKDRIIPNDLVILVGGSGLGLSLMLRPEQIWISLLGAVLVLVALGVLAHYGMMGGGDVKLISATTLLVPPEHIGELMVLIALTGGLLSGVYLVARLALRRSRPGRAAVSTETAGGHGRIPDSRFSDEYFRVAAGQPMPYALAILGGVVVFIARELLQCLSANFCSL
jgi:prepilin peptidase CpaA